MASIKADNSLSYKTDGNGNYYITAVDIAGNESPPSSIIEYKTEPKPIEAKKVTPEIEKIPEDKKEPKEEEEINQVEEQEQEQAQEHVQDENTKVEE